MTRARRGLVARIALACAAACAAFASTAGAVEKEHRVGVDLGASVLSIDDKSTVSFGGGGGAHWSYGLTDQFNLLAEGASSIVALKESGDASTPRTRPTTVSHLAGGLAYTLDVIAWVPYFGVLAGGFVMSGGTLEHALVLPGGQLALGLDYKVSRHFNVGIAARQTMFLVKTSTYPSYTNVFARVEYAWGW